MIKFETLGMYKVAKNDPTVIADGDTINYYIHTIGADGKADAPVAGVSGALQSENLYIAMNELTGDERYTGKKIPDGGKLNSYLLKQFDQQYLIVDEDNITYADGESFASITAGTTNLVAGTDGKLAIAAAVTYYHLYFAVKEKTVLGGKNAVRVQVVLA